MSVYKPKNSPHWHYDFVYKGHRLYGSTGQTARKEAEKVERVKRQAIIMAEARGELDKPAAEIPTLDQAAAEWWDFKGSALKSADTLEERLALAVKLVGKDKPVNEIVTADIAKAIAKRRGILIKGKRPIKNATANRDIIDTIRPIIRRQQKLLNAGHAPIHFPVIDWKEVRLPEPKPKPRDFAPDQIADAFAVLPAHWHDFARMQARYGCRLSEMFFKPTDVDVAGQRVRLRDRKNDGDHTIPLLVEDAAMLASRVGRAKAAKLSTVWFRQLKNGKLKPLTYNAAKWALRRMMRKSGLHVAQGARGSHDLRHHAGMQMLRASKNLRVTQKLLGHENIQSTLVYAHAMEDDVRAGLDALSRMSPEQPENMVGEEGSKELNQKRN